MPTLEEERRRKLLLQNQTVAPAPQPGTSEPGKVVALSPNAPGETPVNVPGTPGPGMSQEELIAALQKEIEARNKRPDITAVLDSAGKIADRPGERKLEIGEDGKLAGGASFDAALAEFKDTGEIRPETKKVLDEIRAQSEIGIEKRVSTAQSFAEKRGLEGSSIEQAGVGAAITEGERERRAAELPFLQDEVAAGERAKFARAEAGFGKSGAEAEAAFQKGTIEFQTEATLDQMFAGFDQATKTLATNLKADELATVRNMLQNNKDRELQKYLGERGVAISRASIQAARDAAEQSNKSSGIVAGATIGASVGGVPGAVVGSLIGLVGSDLF